MSDLDKVYMLYFLVKHSRTCSLWQLNPFIPPLHKRQFLSSSSREKGTQKIWSIYFLSSIVLQLRQNWKLKTIVTFNSLIIFNVLCVMCLQLVSFHDFSTIVIFLFLSFATFTMQCWFAHLCFMNTSRRFGSKSRTWININIWMLVT